MAKEELHKVPKVTGLRAESDNQKVNLSWNKIMDHTLPILKYRIYYGFTNENLDQIVETFSADANWYIPNLENNRTYYFAVTAVDSQGNESLEKSLIESVIPKEKESLVRAVATDSKVTLSWKAFGLNPVRYKIFYGINPDQYLESILTADNRTNWYIPDLINGVTYYFKLAALDSQGREMNYSPEVSATPYGTGFKPVAGGQNFVLPQTQPPKADTGPEVWIVILASLFLVDIALRLKRRIFKA